jgi:hypothetical protein
MPVKQPDTNWSDLSPAEFIAFLSIFADLLLGHHFFKDNWPTYLTHPLKLKEQLKAYEEAENAATVDGGRKNLQERDNLRDKAHGSAILMAQYVVMRSISENDPSFITSVGLKEKTRSKRARVSSKPAILVAPTDLVATHDKNAGSGCVQVSFGKVVGAGSYEIFLSKGDPADEASWNSLGHFKQCRNIRLSGLEPASTVWFKVCSHGNGTHSAFSENVSLIIL